MDFDDDSLKKKLHPNIKIIYRIYLYIHEQGMAYIIIEKQAFSSTSVLFLNYTNYIGNYI